MKKQYLKYIFIIILCLVFFIPNKVEAASDYTITSYNIDMIVNENNTFDITETITAYFNVSKHGIYRKIPLKNEVTRIDGTTSNNRAQISNISVSEDYTTSNESGYKVIKIGSSSKTITGSHTYTIKYTYNIGKDPLKDADELYFNLIGEEWDTNISNITFNIKMPKEFDKSLLGFSSGYNGSTNSSNVVYAVNGNTISGELNSTLTSRQALTVRLTLPEGYFVGAGHKIDGFSVFVIIFCLICILIADRIWKKYGKDDLIIETVEFYPPKGYNSAEIEYLYKGESSNDGIISLLIYLANKGYLKIEETEEKTLFSKSKGFRITKLKEYDGENAIEKIFFNGLFKGSKKSVTKEDLYDSFYTTLNRIRNKLNSEKNKNKIFEKTSSGKGKWLVFMVIIILLLITIKPVLEYYGEDGLEMLEIALMFTGGGLFVVYEVVLGKAPISLKILEVILGLIFGGTAFIFVVLQCLLQNTFYLITYILGIICIATLILFKKIMPKRTTYGNEMFGKIRGFKEFLETAEKPQLESLVMKSPEYFYNILPYTYALGVSDTWIKQFESIALKAPDWYDSPREFDSHSMHSTIKYATTAMSSISPASSSGGGSYSSSNGRSGGGRSGGGHSGGGSGGGGGGSW